MPKRSVEGFQPLRGWIRNASFPSEDDTDRIIAAVGGLPHGATELSLTIHTIAAYGDPPHGDTELRRWLDDDEKPVTVTITRPEVLRRRSGGLAILWSLEAESQTKPTPKQRADAFAKIEKRCDQLLEALSVPADGDIEEMPWVLRNAWAGEGLLEITIHGVCSLRDQASELARLANSERSETEVKKPNKREKRHFGDEALGKLFTGLAKLYRDEFDRPIATSTSASTGHASGPLVRFIHEFLLPLLGEKTPSNDAIASRIRRWFGGSVKSSSKKLNLTI